MVTITQAPRQRCISVSTLPHNHILLVPSEGTAPITKKITNELHGVIMHAETKEIVREGAILLPMSQTFYFAQSDRFPGYSYVLMYFNKSGRYGCSCCESRTFSFCKHQRMVEEV